jgi:hypothetical protein
MCGSANPMRIKLDENLPVHLAAILTSLRQPRASLRDEMRGYDADEFAGSDYLGRLPELWKMPLVAGDQVVGAGGVGAFQELVVVGIPRDLERPHRIH